MFFMRVSISEVIHQTNSCCCIIVSLRRGAVCGIPAGFVRVAKFLVRGRRTYRGAFYGDKRIMASRHSGKLGVAIVSLQMNGISREEPYMREPARALVYDRKFDRVM